MLEVSTKRLESVVVFKLRERIAIGETESLLNRLLSESGVNTVVIDLAGVTAVDAHGLGVLLELRQVSSRED